MANGDKGGQIRFLELLGNGMEEVNRPTEALMFFERAIKIAETEKDSGLPFMAYEGKAQALVALGRQMKQRGWSRTHSRRHDHSRSKVMRHNC